MSYDVVIPTRGRPSLRRLLDSLAGGGGPRPERVLVVDDRPGPAGPELVPGALRSGGRGPAAARNLGWRAGEAEWVVFLDDDVVATPGWAADLERDLAAAGSAAGSQGRIRVPLPPDRPPTDWERSVRGLEEAPWATADMAYRRTALEAAGGFDERFPRAYREDADLALRVSAGVGRLLRGRRVVLHPVLPSTFWTSVARQAGNADDALMDRLHGSGWRERAGASTGLRRRHLLTSAAAAAAVLAALGGRTRAATVLSGAWAGLTAGFAWERIAPGPRTAEEVLKMAVTSAAIPPLASYHWLRGLDRARRLAERPAAVLFDRDGTLIEDVPYNRDPDRVRSRPGARAALDRLRAAGIPVGVVSNQSGIGRGRLTQAEAEAVNRRVEEVLGPFDAWLICPHAPDAGCACRKPSPGLVLEAAARLRVPAGRCAVIGDIGSDVAAARAAGARAILVPTGVTRPEEVAAAPEVAPDLPTAVDRLLGPAARLPAAEGKAA